MARQVIHDLVQLFSRSLRPTVRLRVHFPLPLSLRQSQFRGVRRLVAASADPHENILPGPVRICLQILARDG